MCPTQESENGVDINATTGVFFDNLNAEDLDVSYGPRSTERHSDRNYPYRRKTLKMNSSKEERKYRPDKILLKEYLKGTAINYLNQVNQKQ